MSETINNQKEYLEILRSIALGKYPMRVADYFEGRPGKWYLYDEVRKNKHYDLRNVLPNEILYDIDIKSWEKCREIANNIREYLINEEMPHYPFLSGGKGIHISIFFKIEKTDKIIEALKIAFEKGFQMKDLRSYIHKKIVIGAGLQFDNRIFDTKKVNFDEINKKGSLIRCCGGKKIKENNVTYKIFLGEIEKIPKRKDLIKDKENIKFPTEIKRWKLPEPLILECIESYLKKHKEENKIKNRYNPDFNYEGKFLGLECVQNIIKNGCTEGSRNDGAYIVTIACLKDGLLEEETKAVLIKYRNKCENCFSFDESESFGWINWLKSQPSIYFSHSKSRLLGKCGANCEHHKSRFKKVYELLKKENLLNQIIKVISRDFKDVSKKVVFEDNNLKIIYLGCLSALTSNPLNIKVVGASSDGKTAMVTPVIKYFPKDMIIASQSLSKKSLYYDYDEILPNKTRMVYLSGKVLVLLEESTSLEFINEIKALLSHDMDEVTVKTVIDFSSVTTVLKGWPAYIGLSVENKRSEELETREIIISPISTKEKFKSVIQENAKSNCFEKNFKSEYDDEVKQIGNVLEPLDVYNPYSEELGKIFPSDKGSDMRHWKKFRSLIETHALLYQKQRKIITHNNIKAVIVDLKDILSVLDFFSEGLRSTLTGINFNIKKFWDEVVLGNIKSSEDDKKSWELKEILDKYKEKIGKISDYYLKGMLSVLEEKGFVSIDREKKAHKYSFDFQKDVDEGIDLLKEKIKKLKPKSFEEINEKIMKKSSLKKSNEINK